MDNSINESGKNPFMKFSRVRVNVQYMYIDFIKMFNRQNLIKMKSR